MWNHRIIRYKLSDGEYTYGIHETYYNDVGAIAAISSAATPVMGDSIDEMREILEWMLKSLDTPVLDHDMEFADFDEHSGL